MAEYVQDGRNGLLSDPHCPQTMAAAAVRLLGDPELSRRLGAAAREDAGRDFAWDRLAPAAERAYRAALAPTGPPREGPGDEVPREEKASLPQR
jgi:glycosyltransferase involved in cell wall biosynthesis